MADPLETLIVNDEKAAYMMGRRFGYRTGFVDGLSSVLPQRHRPTRRHNVPREAAKQHADWFLHRAGVALERGDTARAVELVRAADEWLRGDS